MPKADTDEDQLEIVRRDDADLGAPDDKETLGDLADARTEGEAESADQPVDDPVAENDPLVLARLAPKKTTASATPAAKAKSDAAEPPADEDPSDPAEKSDDQEGKAERQAKPIAENVDPIFSAKFSDESWNKLGHQDKTLFLNVQRHGRQASIEASKAKSAAAQHKADYDTVERFRSDQGLENEEYRNGVMIAGAVKRGDARVLPILEETVARLRKQAGLPDPTPTAAPLAAPAVDAEALLAAITKAKDSLEEADFDAVIAMANKLKAPPKTAAPPPAAAAAPAAQPQQMQRQPPEMKPEERESHISVYTFLTEHGIKPENVTSYIQGIRKAHPKLDTIPVGERLREVMRIHKASQAKAAQSQNHQAPVTGQRRVATVSDSKTANKDPLERARIRGTPESRGGR